MNDSERLDFVMSHFVELCDLFMAWKIPGIANRGALDRVMLSDLFTGKSLSEGKGSGNS